MGVTLSDTTSRRIMERGPDLLERVIWGKPGSSFRMLLPFGYDRTEHPF